MEWFKKHEIPVMVHGSTLLNIVRNGTPEGKLKTDREINLMVLEEDFNDDAEWNLRKDYKYFEPIFSDVSDTRSSGMYYAEQNKQFPTDDHWGIDPGIVFLTKMWRGFYEGKSVRYKSHGGDDCLYIPSDLIDIKDNWDDIYILDNEFKAPAGIGKYLDHYYSDWWHVKPGWHWLGSSNLIKLRNIYKGEIC